MNNDRYLFRGFHKAENGKETIYLDGREIIGHWVYGYILKIDDCYLMVARNSEIQGVDITNDNIMFSGCVHVIPKTVGQYTSLDDKNGKKIFENDLIKCSWLPIYSQLEVIFTEGSFYLKAIDGRRISFAEVIERIKGNVQGNIEVIGTRFDDKEVM